MPSNIGRVRAREVSGLADELAVRLRVLEESRPEVRIRVDARPVGAGGKGTSLENMDIEGAMFTVVMEVSRAARDDMKAMLQDIKAINKAKASLRKVTSTAMIEGDSSAPRPRGRAGTADLDAVLNIMLSAYGIVIQHDVERLIRQLEAADEISEMESLGLQMALDRLSKMMSTLSNVLKKISDTSQQLVQNIR